MFSRKSTLAALTALAVTASGALAQSKPSAHHSHPMMPALPSISYKTFTLPNGLTVITHEDHRLPLVAVDLWYHVGPLNERAGRTGFAHLFEHMMFEGSEHVGEKAHIKYVEAAGATDVNGTTDFDRTNYFETMPSNQLELAMWLESDRMGFLMEGLNRELLANQRDVVRNERRQGEGRPYDVADEAMFHQLFPKSHPYYASVIGSHADIEAARIADIRDFHQQYYTPNNASIAIAGDFNPEQLKALLMKYFGPIPKGPAVPPVNVTTPPITSQKRETVTDTVQLPRLSIGWLTPAAFTPDAYAVQSAMFALGEAKVSRLNKALVIDKGIAQRVSCEVDPLKLTGIAGCDVIAKPGVKLEDLEKATWEVINTLRAEGPTAAEVSAAKATELTGKITGLQRLGGFGGVADTLDRYNQYTGDPGYLGKDVAAAQGVTVAQAKAAANTYLSPDHAVVIYCVPGKKMLDDVPRSPADTDANVKITNPYSEQFETAQNWRKTPPAPGPAVAFHLPAPQTFTLSNGLKVLYVEDHTLPVVSAVLTTRAGAENNPAGKFGIASLTASTMGEATTTQDVSALAAAEEAIGTRLRTGATVDGASASITMLSQYSDPGFSLLGEVVEHPAFAPADFDRLKKQTLVGIQQQTDNVQQMAFRAGPRMVFGDQPYGYPAEGTLKSVKGLTREDAQSFYTAHYGPADSALILAGDVSTAQAKAMAEKYFGGWNGTANNAATLPVAPQQKPTYIAIVDKPGAPQTAVFAFGVGVPANSPDLPTIQVMNYILGGAFASRINMNLREKHGYTYGASSGYRTYRTGGMFLAGGLIRTNATADAVKELMGEITRFPTAPPTDTELKEAKDAEVQSLPGQFETTGATAGAMQSIFLYDRPLDFYATLPDRYRAVTAADVERVAKEDIHPDQLVIVTAGDRSKIEDGLKADGLGDVHVVDINGAAAK